MSSTAQVERNDEGFMTNAAEWSEDIAKTIAQELDIELSDKHWEVINFLRKQHESGVEMSIRKLGKSGIVDIKELYQLFPGGPLKNASKIAGLPRPTSCV